MSNWQQISQRLVMVGQLGLSLLMPLVLCLLACFWLNTRLSAPLWIYLPGFLLGLGGSFMTAYKFWLRVRKEEEEKQKKEGRPVSFSSHR